jgi:outer membrane protein assembly factor BamB
VLPHDLFDWDLACPVILTRARGRTVALTAGKMGFAYAFDAQTGKLLWKRSVGIHNGHDHDGLEAMRGRLRRIRGPVTVLPGSLGGVETPMAVSRGTLYVPVEDISSNYFAERFGQTPPLERGTGELVALDVASGRVRWRRRFGQDEFGGATVVNDLVITSTYEGILWGLRAETGDVVWRSTLTAGTNTPVAVVGDTLIAAASVPLEVGEGTGIFAYRLPRP